MNITTAAQHPVPYTVQTTTPLSTILLTSFKTLLCIPLVLLLFAAHFRKEVQKGLAKNRRSQTKTSKKQPSKRNSEKSEPKLSKLSAETKRARQAAAKKGIFKADKKKKEEEEEGELGLDDAWDKYWAGKMTSSDWSKMSTRDMRALQKDIADEPIHRMRRTERQRNYQIQRNRKKELKKMKKWWALRKAGLV